MLDVPGELGDRGLRAAPLERDERQQQQYASPISEGRPFVRRPLAPTDRRGPDAQRTAQAFRRRWTRRARRGAADLELIAVSRLQRLRELALVTAEKRVGRLADANEWCRK